MLMDIHSTCLWTFAVHGQVTIQWQLVVLSAIYAYRILLSLLQVPFLSHASADWQDFTYFFCSQ
jgi:hypothetical protein